MAVIVILWLATGLLTLDAIRRPSQQWVIADRNKGFWVTGLVFSSLVLFPAVVFVPGYALGVMSRFADSGHGARRSSVSEFRRS